MLVDEAWQARNAQTAALGAFAATTALIQPAFYPHLPFASLRPAEHAIGPGEPLPEIAYRAVPAPGGPDDPALTATCAARDYELLDGHGRPAGPVGSPPAGEPAEPQPGGPQPGGGNNGQGGEATGRATDTARAELPQKDRFPGRHRLAGTRGTFFSWLASRRPGSA
jgi:hypothetical protein